jgi:long-chain acyl-CoA synthetase
MSTPDKPSAPVAEVTAPSGPDTSLVDELRARAAERPSGLALLRKRHGIWETTTWSELTARVERLAGALRERGVAPGGTVVVIGDATPEWLTLDLAVQAVGGLSVALYPQQSREDIRAAMADVVVDLLAGGDDEQLGRAYDALPAARHQLLLDARSLRRASDGDIELVRDLANAEQLPTSELSPARGAVGVVSSGTSGSPRLVQISQREAVAFARRAADWLALTRSDRNLCHVPCALPAARLLDLYAPICVGSTIAFPESPQTIVENLVELQPTVITTTPRALELLAADSELRAVQSGRVKRAANRWARRQRERGVGDGDGDAATHGSRRTPSHYLVDRQIVKHLGLRQARRVVSAGAPVAPMLLERFWSLRVPVVDAYGQPETLGLAFAQRGPQDVGTTGPPLTGVQPRIVGGSLRLRLVRDNGEEEWLETEDMATLDAEGRLVLTGAASDVAAGPDGDRLVLSGIEGRLRMSPYVREAVVVPARTGGAHALIEFDFEAVSSWLSEQGYPVSAYDQLARDPTVIGMIDDNVRAANQDLRAGERVAAFRLLERPLSLEHGDVSPNRRVRRARVRQSFAAQLAEMDSAG